MLGALGGNVTRMGEVGAGQVAKVLNQAIVGAGDLLMAEALALAEAAGLDAAALPACLAGIHADSNLLRRIYPRMQQRDFAPPLGYARQLLKDFDAVQHFAEAHGLRLAVVEAPAGQFRDRSCRSAPPPASKRSCEQKRPNYFKSHELLHMVYK